MVLRLSQVITEQNIVCCVLGMPMGTFRLPEASSYMKQWEMMIMCGLEEIRVRGGHDICLHISDGCHIRVGPNFALWNSMSPSSQWLYHQGRIGLQVLRNVGPHSGPWETHPAAQESRHGPASSAGSAERGPALHGFGVNDSFLSFLLFKMETCKMIHYGTEEELM